MKALVSSAIVLASIFGLGVSAQACEQWKDNSAPIVIGIDTSVSDSGYAQVMYEGRLYNLTEGDTLHGLKVVLIDTQDHEVVYSQNGSMHEVNVEVSTAYENK